MKWNVLTTTASEYVNVQHSFYLVFLIDPDGAESTFLSS